MPDWYESTHSPRSTTLHSAVVHDEGVAHSSVQVVVVSHETRVLASGGVVKSNERAEQAARKMSVRFTRTHRLGAQEGAKSLSTRVAALWPAAPMTEPAGCVPALHE